MEVSYYTAIFIVAFLILSAFVVSWVKHRKKKMNQQKLLKQFENFVIKHQLTIDKKQLLHRNIIGIDRLNKKLVFLDNRSEPAIFSVINLEDLCHCDLIKQKNLSDHISRISLLCICKNDLTDLEIPFYDEFNDHIFKMMRLFKKAHYWQKTINIFRETAILSETFGSSVYVDS